MANPAQEQQEALAPPVTEQRKEEFIVTFVRTVNEHISSDGRGPHRQFRFLWRFGELSVWFSVVGGRIVDFLTQPGIDRSWDFSFAAPDGVWMEFLRPFPRSPYHHLFGLWARVPSFTLDGNREVIAQNAGFVNEMMRIARSVWCESGREEIAAAPQLQRAQAVKEEIVASYRGIQVGTEVCRIYVEEAGQGPDLLFLHTAGSDSRQFYHLLNDKRLASRWRMVAFDMPAHGKSHPSVEWVDHEYRLSTAAYVDTVLAFVEQMGLKKPVVLGCSMAGALCLKLAQSHPSRFAAVIACEAAERIPGRLHDWLRHPRVDSAEFGPQWVDGLMSPYSPQRYRQEVLWQYSQAAAGVFFGDVAFYSGEFRMSDLGKIDTNKCPVYMLTGEYDYSCTPEMSRLTAEKIPGARFREMKKLGHFPMSENPEAFMSYLLPILEEIRPGTER